MIVFLPLLLLWWTFQFLCVVTLLLLRLALAGVRYGIAAHQNRRYRKDRVPI